MPFPNSPTDGDIYTDPVSQKRYIYNSANSLWSPKERKKIEDLGSTDQATVPTPTDGSSLYSSIGTDYGAVPGVTNDYQKWTSTSWFQSDSEGLTYPGDMVVSSLNNSTTGLASTLASSDTERNGGTASGTQRILQCLHGGNYPDDYGINSGNISFTFRYLSATAAIQRFRLYLPPSTATASTSILIFSGSSIDLAGYDSTNYGTHPQVVEYQTSSFGNSSTTRATVTGWTFSDSDNSGVLVENGIYTIHIWRPSGGFRYHTINVSRILRGLRAFTTSPTIRNGPTAVGPTRLDSNTRSYLYFLAEGSITTSATVGASYGISPQSFAAKEQSFFGNQEVEIVPSLPGAPPWYGYSDGYTVYNSGDSTLYRWEAGTSSWQAI